MIKGKRITNQKLAEMKRDAMIGAKSGSPFRVVDQTFYIDVLNMIEYEQEVRKEDKLWGIKRRG